MTDSNWGKHGGIANTNIEQFHQFRPHGYGTFRRIHEKYIHMWARNSHIIRYLDILLMNSTCIRFRWQRSLQLALRMMSIDSIRVWGKSVVEWDAHFIFDYISMITYWKITSITRTANIKKIFNGAAPNRNRRNSSFISFLFVFVSSFWIRWPLRCPIATGMRRDRASHFYSVRKKMYNWMHAEHIRATNKMRREKNANEKVLRETVKILRRHYYCSVQS